MRGSPSTIFFVFKPDVSLNNAVINAALTPYLIDVPDRLGPVPVEFILVKQNYTKTMRWHFSNLIISKQRNAKGVNKHRLEEE